MLNIFYLLLGGDYRGKAKHKTSEFSLKAYKDKAPDGCHHRGQQQKDADPGSRFAIFHDSIWVP